MSADIEPEGDWYGLYKSGSRDDHLFTTSSTRHPAKMSLALTNKILDTMQEWGWIETGSLVVDPFGGRGTTALCWLARHPANRALTVELEPHFVEMQQKNKEHAQRRLHRELAWVILQGDSRRFSEYYADGKAASVLSAPYADQAVSQIKSDRGNAYRRGEPGGSANNVEVGYGSTPGQIGNLPDSAITSAPYSGDVKHDRTFAERDARADEKKDLTNACGRGSFRGSPTYGDTPGQIGNLKDPPAASVLSAPYAAAENRRAAGKVQQGEVSDAITRAYDATNHGQTAGNIANLPDKDVAAITSAPYGPSETATPAGRVERRLERIRKGVEDGTITGRESVRIAARGANPNTNIVATGDGTGYGATPGQIANLPDKDAAAVTSAPFEDSLASDDPEKRGGFLQSDPKRRNDPGLTATYTDAAAVTSAPYETSINDHNGIDPTKFRTEGGRCGKTSQALSGGYRDTSADNQQGQIGGLQSESYADACGKVYASLAKAGIRYVASVTKDPTRAGKLRPLRLLTISLFEQAGYRLVAWRRAWLYHTQAELDAMAGQESLFGDEVEESKRLVGRLSFFRRLSLSKGGIASPYEDCLFFELARPDPAVCKHGIPQGQYCAPCDDDYIARQEASPVGQPAQPPRWVQPELS